jgi:CheY-like chemotaxis protein
MTESLPDKPCDVAGDDREPGCGLDEVVYALLGRRVRDLRVGFSGGGLVLRGRADSYHAKQLAQHVAMAALGLPLSANEIVVTDSRHETPRPAERGEPGPRPRVLVASGDDRLRSECSDCLAAHGPVVTAAGGVECTELLREFTPDAVVLDTDLRWGGADGVLAHLRARGDTTVPVVLLTSQAATPPEGGRPVESPVVAVIEKPVEMDVLVRAVLAAGGRGAATDPGRERPARGGSTGR